MESVYSGKSCKRLLARESESASSVLSHVDNIFPLCDVRRKALYLCGGSCLFVTKPCLIFCDPMDCSMPRFPDLHCLLEFLQTHVHWDGDAIQPSHPLLPPSLPALNLSQHQSLSKVSALRIRWLKYWSFSFSVSPSNEYSGLNSFRIDWFDIPLWSSSPKPIILLYPLGKHQATPNSWTFVLLKTIKLIKDQKI